MRFSFTDEGTYISLPRPCNTFVVYRKAVHIELNFEAKFLWIQLWTTCLTFQASLRLEAAERGSGVPESQRWAAGADR